MTEREIFIAALHESDPVQRVAFLDRACGGDQALRLQLEELLGERGQLGSFLEQPAADREGIDISPTQLGLDNAAASPEKPGAMIGPYKLLEQVGEGGMGTVWMAEQTDPIRRRVAVKVVKEGMDSRQVLARFEAERQALALMEHPNIAKVLDAGRTPSGRPYFVMELVKGQPITKYCDEKRLGVRARLELFGDVCRAVQHAHQKGIIHRDVKPSNVLVAPYDGKPVVKVIDFGVAKAISQRLTDQTLITGFGALVGTPEYMSPEQAEINNQDIDTRSDIYALGVLLYELLTGTTPLTRKRLHKEAFLEILRVIREEEPPRPSARLSESKDTLPSISVQRQMEPAKLTKLVRGELDWIVMKALEKNRTRRYQTAHDFATDVERYLVDEPVQACPPSVWYRLRKFTRRHKVPLLAVAVVLVALVGGIVGTTWQLVRAERAVAAEKTANELTNKRLAQIQKGNEIVAGIFADLDVQEVRQGNRPLEAVLAERLIQVADQLEGESVGEPLAVAALQERLGRSLISLGFAHRAIPILQKSRRTLLKLFGREHPATLSTAVNLGQSYQETGKLKQALALFGETLPLAKSRLGPDHPDTLVCMSGLGETYLATGRNDRAVSLLVETFRLRKTRLGPEHPSTLSSMNNLAVAYEVVGRFDRSLPLKKETLRLEKARFGPDHPKTIGAMGNLAEGYRAAGKFDLALRLFKESYTVAKARLGPYHPLTLVNMNNLGFNYHHAGKFDRARPLLEEAYRLMKVKLGTDHFDTLTCMVNLANCYRDMNKIVLALSLYKGALERTKTQFGRDHARNLVIMYDLAEGYRAAGKPERALRLFETTYQRMKATHGPKHSDTINCMTHLAESYRAAGKLDRAIPLFMENLKRTKAKLGPNHPDTLSSMNNLANGYYAAGKFDLAMPLFQKTFKRMAVQLGPDHSHTLTCMNGLATCYRTAGKLDRALPLFEELHKRNKAQFGPDDHRTLGAMHELAFCYWSLGQLDKSVPLFEDLLKRREATCGRRQPGTLQTIANLGLNYVDAGRLEQGLALLEEAYQASKHDAKLRWVGSNLLRRYIKAGKADRARALAKELRADARRTLPPDGPKLAAKLALVGSALLTIKEFADAEPVLRECLSIRTKKQPDRWATFNTRSQLGGALLGQKKYAAAEPLLLQGYEGMNQRRKTIPPKARANLSQAADRLVALYTATHQPGELKRWQAERAKYPAAMKSSLAEKK
jgi:serine/threonine protein kinase/tetratricopeptide (TPR) repeat protein